MSIHELVNKIKGWGSAVVEILNTNKNMVVIGSIIAFSSVFSYYLGYITNSNPSIDKNQIVINCEKKSPSNLNESAPVSNFSQSDVSTGVQSKSGYVASKNGKIYYPTDCTSVSRIKDSNRVYFKTDLSARAAGYSKSNTCN